MTDPAALPNFPPPADQHPLRGRVLDALHDLSVQPNIDEDGDVSFTVNDQSLFARCHEGELQILRIFGQWQLPEQIKDDREHLLTVCNELNLTLNCVKCGLGPGTLAITNDQLLTPGTDLNASVQVGIQLVLSTVHFWHQRALGLEGDGESGGGDSGGGESGSGESGGASGDASGGGAGDGGTSGGGAGNGGPGQANGAS